MSLPLTLSLVSESYVKCCENFCKEYDKNDVMDFHFRDLMQRPRAIRMQISSLIFLQNFGLFRRVSSGVKHLTYYPVKT